MTKENPHKRYRNLFIISLSFIVIFIFTALYLLYQSQQAQFWNDHRRKMEMELDEVLSGLYEMTTASSGYLITGRPESITPYKHAEMDIDNHLQNAYLLVNNEKEQKRMMDTLSVLITKRKMLLNEVIDIYKQSRYLYDSTAAKKINSRVLAGDVVMDKIRIEVKSIIAYEQYLYRQRIGMGDNFNRLSYIIIICFGLITITVSLYAYSMLQQENRQKLAVQQQLTEYYAKVEKANIMLTEAEKLAQIGSWEWDIPSNKVLWSDGVYKVYQLSPDTFTPSYEAFIDIIHKEDREKVVQTIHEAMEEKKSYHIEFRETASGQGKIIYAVGVARLDNKGNLIGYYGIIGNITQQRSYEKQLEDFNTALKKSNEELEEFAYVASHDLQEPLRKIRAFGDRLMFKYGHEVEMPGREYIMKMMDGAERMQILIQDLLAFSRVSRDAGDKMPVDLNEAVKAVLEDLQLSISESNTDIQIEKLPSLPSANPVQMHQLFLNLISNAIKFRKENIAPKIKIKCKIVKGDSLSLLDQNIPAQKSFYEIIIHDNGIGFDEKYLDRIFTIFQRLHGRNEYKGTGIGLAVCKKICSNHGGYISARSDGKTGSDFIVYLPQ